jgi:hypothetical protein
MKTIILSLLSFIMLNVCSAQPIPADSLYLSQTPPGIYPAVFPLQFSSGLRPVERISITSDGKEIYYGELNTWPATIQRVKCYKYLSDKWQGPFVVFEGFVAPALSASDSIIYMQKDVSGTACTFYSTRNSTGWNTPVRLLSSNLQSHYFRETQQKNYYLASNPGGNSDICKLVIQNSDTTIQSLGKPINTIYTENDFFIARDESYIIFFRLMSPYDLFISYHKSNGSWTNPKSFGVNINTNIYECCPYVTNDKKYLFFTRGGSAMSSYYTYWVKIDNIIDSLKHTNYVPYLKNQIPNQTDTVGNLFTLIVPDSTFIDDDGNNGLTYSASLSNNDPLPSWLSFDSTARKLYGTPVASGLIELKIKVKDTANTYATCTFNLNVIDNTLIHPLNQNTVNEYKLYQNFPNPFNPNTVISYSLLNNSNVTVKLYDMLGKEIATLVNSYQKRGLYDVNLNMNNLNLASGLYFYTLNVNEQNSGKVFKETKVMSYIK